MTILVAIGIALVVVLLVTVVMAAITRGRK